MTLGSNFLSKVNNKLSLKTNLPVIPRVRHAVTDEEVQNFYTNVFKQVFEKAASSLLRRYARDITRERQLHCATNLK